MPELFDSVLCALDHVPLVVETERTVGGHLLERLNVLFLSKERRGLAAIRGAHLSPDCFVGFKMSCISVQHPERRKPKSKPNRQSL